LLDFGDVPAWLSAVANVLTLVIAGAAAWFGLGQLKEARRLREDQSRPYVVVDFEISGSGHPHMDIVVSNIGTTLARDIRLSFDPPLRSTLDDDPQVKRQLPPISKSHLFSEVIPTMAPGKVYRVLFENMPDRYKRDDLPRRYEVTVELSGPHGSEEPLKQILDLNMYYGTPFVEVHNLHHIAKSLRAWAKKNGVHTF
jgi:hypothetical protein